MRLSILVPAKWLGWQRNRVWKIRAAPRPTRRCFSIFHSEQFSRQFKDTSDVRNFGILAVYGAAESFCLSGPNSPAAPVRKTDLLQQKVLLFCFQEQTVSKIDVQFGGRASHGSEVFAIDVVSHLIGLVA